jgi:hypothetical protein
MPDIKKRRKEPKQVCVFLDPVNTKTRQVSKYLNSWGFVFLDSYIDKVNLLGFLY